MVVKLKVSRLTVSEKYRVTVSFSRSSVKFCSTGGVTSTSTVVACLALNGKIGLTRFPAISVIINLL